MMKSYIFLTILISVNSAFAGVGGFSGGPKSNSSYVTVEVCDGGEISTMCRSVTYKVRGESPKAEVEICYVNQGEAELQVPCDRIPKGAIPRWLQKLNKVFLPTTDSSVD